MKAPAHRSAELPSGRDLRRWARAHTVSTRSRSALLGDVYDTVLAAAVIGAMAAPYLGRLGTGSTPSGNGSTVVAPVWAVLLLILVLTRLLLDPLRRLGPLFLRPYEVTWWLPMPGDRRGLLDPVARAEMSLAVAVGAATGLLMAVVAGAEPTTAAGMILLGGSTAELLLLALVQAQVNDAGVRGAGAAVLIAAATAFAAGVGGVPFPDHAGGALFTASGLLAGLAAVAWWWRLRTRLVDVPDARLAEVAARNLGAQVSLLSLDTRALGRLLSAPARRPSGSSRLPLVRFALRLPRGLRPLLGVAQADWLLLRRQPRRALQLLAGLVIALFPVMSSGVGTVGALVFHLIGGWVAVLTLAEPARRAWFDGGADASWPASPLLVRCGHLLVPTVVMILWTVPVVLVRLLTAGRLPATAGEAWAVLGLVLVAGCGWAGAALRSGFRPTPDFSLGLVASPIGSLPPGAVEMLVSGPDAAALVGLPTALLAAGVSKPEQMLLAQLVASAVVIAWGLLTGNRMLRQ
ncbi:DUF6297 family protein [Actinomyces sp. 565]|uniref:DUF6297 family protein n=1 Tax=Actinomyces sp. 565 TaxID=2057794 RepID=UPI0013A7057D|nr:DUF6297 family protein [Actinomyces sp. 565]NDR54090.1 hypothetical protein [Actinomyces sp. 565]